MEFEFLFSSILHMQIEANFFTQANKFCNDSVDMG